MTSKQRLLGAIKREKTDRLPVTTHHLMPYFLDTYMGGLSNEQFFAAMGLDAIRWVYPHMPDAAAGCYFNPNQGKRGFLEPRLIASEHWLVSMSERRVEAGLETTYTFATPQGALEMRMQANGATAWVTEHLVKRKEDIELIAAFATAPLCDVEAVNVEAEAYGDTSLIRGHVCGFDVFGQPGCWQDACCLYGTEKMIMETYDDPAWVREFLEILQKRKLRYVSSTKGARYDILELGGGDASTTVISPQIFQDFVAPYDSEIIAAAHEAGQRIVYHTCGGMMPILEDIASMGPDAMETFTPQGMGGDSDLGQAKRRIGNRVCMIGGFDQGRYFSGASEAETRGEVRRCFLEAGEGGGFILSPSDHFFDADPRLIAAFADEAKRCLY
jgi:uroporphyrinogen decarboxylase